MSLGDVDHHLSVSLLRSQATDLAVLISRMQKNADQVEKNILRSEELLALVRSPHTPEPLRLEPDSDQENKDS